MNSGIDNIISKGIGTRRTIANAPRLLPHDGQAGSNPKVSLPTNRLGNFPVPTIVA
jgi:hypothetical protein